MTIDLTSFLEASHRWDPEDGIKFARRVADSVPGASLDWDEGAGEDWAAISKGSAVVGFVSVRVALAFLSTDFCGPAGAGMVIVPVEDFESPQFRATRASIEALVHRSVPEQLDVEGFSIKDLIWATI